MLMDEQVAMAMGNEDLIRITSEGDMDGMGASRQQSKRRRSMLSWTDPQIQMRLQLLHWETQQLQHRPLENSQILPTTRLLCNWETKLSRVTMPARVLHIYNRMRSLRKIRQLRKQAMIRRLPWLKRRTLDKATTPEPTFLRCRTPSKQG